MLLQCAALTLWGIRYRPEIPWPVTAASWLELQAIPTFLIMFATIIVFAPFEDGWWMSHDRKERYRNSLIYLTMLTLANLNALFWAWGTSQL